MGVIADYSADWNKHMSVGPIASSVIGTSDIVAPGAPIFGSFRQINNSLGELDVQLPGADSDGSPLTGLKHLSLVTVIGNDPFAGLSVAEIIASGASVVVTPTTDADAGSVKTLSVSVLSPGETQTFYAWADDDNG